MISCKIYKMVINLVQRNSSRPFREIKFGSCVVLRTKDTHCSFVIYIYMYVYWKKRALFAQRLYYNFYYTVNI